MKAKGILRKTMTCIAVLAVGTISFGAPAYADPSGSASSPEPKKFLATTPDIKPPTYPIAKYRPVPKPPAKGAQRGVVAVTALPDGGGVVTFYQPAPGVSDTQLYQKLKERGVSGLVDPAAGDTVGTRDVNTCAWGSATTAACPQIHWTRNGYSHPQVYFVDHSGDAWPVTAAVPVWNRAQGVDSWYRWANCPGKRGTHCVHVWSDDYGDIGWVGLTNIVWNSNRDLVDGDVYVLLNDYYSYLGANRRRKSTCHELGHALGMGHNSSANSCLIQGAYEPLWPNGDDFALIHDVYPY